MPMTESIDFMVLTVLTSKPSTVVTTTLFRSSLRSSTTGDIEALCGDQFFACSVLRTFHVSSSKANSARTAFVVLALCLLRHARETRRKAKATNTKTSPAKPGILIIALLGSPLQGHQCSASTWSVTLKLPKQLSARQKKNCATATISNAPEK
eukprot:Skav210354  [mRNA]  locus=scaffold1491:63738:72962:- [translate_table: standard]